MIGAKLLENDVDVMGPVVLWSRGLIVRREIREEVPSQDRRFVASPDCLKHIPEGDPLGLISSVEPPNTMV